MDVNTITKVSVFDFDGTMIDTELPNTGKAIWEKHYGESWPHRGWWGRRESLDIDAFENALFDDMASAYRNEKNNENTFVSLCTGRIVPLRKQVEAILNKYNLDFDEVVLAGQEPWNKGANDTLKFKINYLNDLKNRFPNLEMVEIWDDRNEHHPTFVQWGKLQEYPVKVNHVHKDNA